MGNAFRFGVVGLGQLGAALAMDFAQKANESVQGFDPFISDDNKRKLAQSGVTVVDDIAQFQGHEVVLVAVPYRHSLNAVQKVVAVAGAGTIIVDLTSADAESKKVAARAAAQAGRMYVDGAVLGPAADGIAVPIIISGPQADAAADVCRSVGMNVDTIGHEVGMASSIKIVRSVLAKGLEALYVEGLLAARRLGILDPVFDSFCAMLDKRSAADMARLLVTTHPMHAQRRVEEVEMSTQALADIGMPLHMTHATIKVFLDTVAAAGSGAAPQTAASDNALRGMASDFDGVLQALDESRRRLAERRI